MNKSQKQVETQPITSAEKVIEMFESQYTE